MDSLPKWILIISSQSCPLEQFWQYLHNNYNYNYTKVTITNRTFGYWTYSTLDWASPKWNVTVTKRNPDYIFADNLSKWFTLVTAGMCIVDLLQTECPGYCPMTSTNINKNIHQTKILMPVRENGSTSNAHMHTHAHRQMNRSEA